MAAKIASWLTNAHTHETQAHDACPGLKFGTPRTVLLGIVTLGFAAAVHLIYKHHTDKRARQNAPPSRLMALPAELRNAVYQHLLEPDTSLHRKASSATWYTCFGAFFVWLLPFSRLLLPFLPPPRRKSTPTYEHLNILTLVNRQFKREYMDVHSRMATFNFTLDASDTTLDRPFNIGAETLSRMRKCALRILATPGIVGAFDPREATGDWLLRDKVFEAMAQMKELQDMSLSIQACGNQLWNPLWLWHFTSQAFKASPIKAFRRIDFRLEGWTLREPNHLARNTKGEWEWRCSAHHCVQPDGHGEQPVRDFCAALYHECRICDQREV